MARRLIGTGTTNAQGIATCNATYTGVGAGKLQIIAVSGDLESQTYELTDCEYLDPATTSKYNDSRWYQWDSYPSTVTRGTTETTIEKQTSSTTGYHIYSHPDAFGDELAEFDVYVTSTVNNDIFLQIRTSNRTVVKQVALSTFNLSAGEWYHFIIDFKTGTISNTTNTNTSTFTTDGSKAIYLAVQTGQDNIKYKNFMIYPI